MLNILFIYSNHYHDSKILGFIYFVGLKIHRKSLVYADQCRIPSWTLQNKSGPSKVTPPMKDTWLRAKTAPGSMYIAFLFSFAFMVVHTHTYIYVTHFYMKLLLLCKWLWFKNCVSFPILVSLYWVN